jgi:hypothetical protein
MELEKKVLEGIIEMLDEQEGEKLKKHPKLMAMQVEVEKKPKLEEMPELEEKEDESEMELTPELIQKLLEMQK